MSDKNPQADAYKSAGVDIAEADAGLRNIVRHITGTWPASGIGAVQLPIGYFANVIDIGGDRIGHLHRRGRLESRHRRDDA